MNMDEFKKEELISIIMPAYNCEDYVGEALDLVIKQTYQNWELIVIDDCSSDKTSEIIKDYLLRDKRIKYHKLDKNSGAAVARNKAIDLATGKYMAFLDSDDLWSSDKLEKQINFMEKNKYVFTSTSYTKVDDNGNCLKIRYAKPKLNYDGILKNGPGNSTVIYNAEQLGKIKIPNIRKRNDYVMWLKVIKKAKYLYGIEEPLASYRVRAGSLSKNKFALVKYQWKVYREIEKLSFIKAVNLMLYQMIMTVFKLR